jgi:2,3-diaminopropionate biosynthesis protein SbnB
MQAITSIEVGERKPTELPDHLLQLPDSDWALWRCAAVRGAGFPSADVLKLRSAESTLAADQLIAAENDARRLQQVAVESLRTRLNDLFSDQAEPDKALKSSLMKVIKKLKQSDLPVPPVSACADDSLGAYEAARRHVDLARANYEQTFKQEILSLSHAIQQIATDDRFREAVTWQNRHCFGRAIDALLHTPDSVRQKARRGREELVAKYLQRYAVKNDTIGFFGPVGWARLDETEASMRVKVGPEFVAQRTVYFEQWCIQTLVDKLNEQQSLRPWMTACRLPSVYLEGTNLYHPLTGTRRIPVEQATLLRLCDGTRTAKELAQHLMNSEPATFRSEALVYGMLQSLRNKSLIFWGFDVPYALYPERSLRRQLSKIDDPSLRQTALAPLDELESARERISQAAGDSQKLDEAIVGLETTFSRVTNEAATRRGGETYAARTLVYEDCRRDIEVVMGQEVLQSLAPPLSLLLSSCRWLTCEMARTYRQIFKQIYEELLPKAHGKQVDALAFWLHVHALILNDTKGEVADLVTEFHSKWANILALPLNESRVHYRSEQLRPKVLGAFPAPGPGWAFARHHSPDVMIAAESVEAIQRGDFQFILGELHMSANTLGTSLFVSQHPSPDDLRQWYDADLPETWAVPMQLREWHTTRTFCEVVSPRHYRIELEPESFATDRSKALALAELVVEERGDELVMCTRDRRLSFELIDVFGGLLSGLAVDLFKLLPTKPHTPRITIDRLTIARETWNFAPATLSWALLKEESERFLAVRRWAKEFQLPSRVFVRVPVEHKPFYVDFESPVYVNILARMVRRTIETHDEKATVKVVEMVPQVEQCWLPDSAGNHYTSEFRIIALDLAQHPYTAQRGKYFRSKTNRGSVMSNDDVLLLKGQDIATLLEGRELEIVEAARMAYRAHAEGKSSLPQSTLLQFPNEDKNRIIALPAYLGDGFGVAGIKWISSFTGNLSKGMERASAVLILNSMETGRPEAIMEGSIISAKRTAASAALAAHTLLSGREIESAGLLGCGPINYETSRFLRALCPGLKRLHIFDLDAHRAQQFKDISHEMFDEIVVTEDPRSLFRNNPLIAFATNAVKPHVFDLSDCAPGTVVLHTSLRDLAAEVILSCENVVDDVEHVSRAQTSIHLAEQLSGNRSFIRCTLGDILLGRSPATESANKITVFSPFGLGILDLAVAKLARDLAVKENRGINISSFLPASWIENSKSSRLPA